MQNRECIREKDAVDVDIAAAADNEENDRRTRDYKYNNKNRGYETTQPSVSSSYDTRNVDDDISRRATVAGTLFSPYK